MTRPAHRDSLASPTMAQIFMRQGHWRRARETLDALLEAHPLAGPALALRARIDALDTPALHARVDGEAIEARWQRAPIGAHLVIVYFAGPSVYATSTLVAEESGRHRFTPPSRWRQGAAALCLVRLDGGRPTPLAIADAISFGA